MKAEKRLLGQNCTPGANNLSALVKHSGLMVVSRGQTAFSVFLWGGGKKGLVWFTVATRLGTFEVLIYRVIIDLGL